MAVAGNSCACAVVVWESVNDEGLEEPLTEVVSSKYLVHYGGDVLMSHNKKTYRGKLESTHATATKARNHCDILNGLNSAERHGRPKRNKKKSTLYSSSSETEQDEVEDNAEVDQGSDEEFDETLPLDDSGFGTQQILNFMDAPELPAYEQRENINGNLEQSSIQQQAKKTLLLNRKFSDESQESQSSSSQSRHQERKTSNGKSSDESQYSGKSSDESQYSDSVPQRSQSALNSSLTRPLTVNTSPVRQRIPLASNSSLNRSYIDTSPIINRSSPLASNSSLPWQRTSSPSTGGEFITRAEIFHELGNFVRKDEFELLKSKHERLKRKMREVNVNDEDNYDGLIRDFGPHAMYDACKVLTHHSYTDDEILQHTVSGKRANSNIQNVKPKFTPNRFNKIKAAMQKKYPETLNDTTLLTKRVTAVQKRLKMDKLKEK